MTNNKNRLEPCELLMYLYRGIPSDSSFRIDMIRLSILVRIVSITLWTAELHIPQEHAWVPQLPHRWTECIAKIAGYAFCVLDVIGSEYSLYSSTATCTDSYELHPEGSSSARFPSFFHCKKGRREPGGLHPSLQEIWFYPRPDFLTTEPSHGRTLRATIECIGRKQFKCPLSKDHCSTGKWFSACWFPSVSHYESVLRGSQGG